jgi:hypothetical protein
MRQRCLSKARGIISDIQSSIEENKTNIDEIAKIKLEDDDVSFDVILEGIQEKLGEFGENLVKDEEKVEILK